MKSIKKYKMKHSFKMRRKEKSHMSTMEILTLLLVIVGFLDYIKGNK